MIYICMIWWYMIDISVIILMINNISDMEIHISGDTRGPFCSSPYIYRYLNFFEACFLITRFIWSHLYLQDIFLRLKRNVRHWDPNRPETLGFHRCMSPWEVCKLSSLCTDSPRPSSRKLKFDGLIEKVHEFRKRYSKEPYPRKGVFWPLRKWWSTLRTWIVGEWVDRWLELREGNTFSRTMTQKWSTWELPQSIWSTNCCPHMGTFLYCPLKACVS